ncbi:MAG: T9SS type A sorting domain-containing protein [Bacteroidales bacterium]|nr:T9SS type A sorting domain-containing protein [Bacteroidales bacterium]
MKKLINNLTIIFLLCILSSVSCYAQIITAASCSQEDVLTALNLASDGDTIMIPEGQSIWRSSIDLKGKSINIFGAGIGKTIIIDSTSSDWKQTIFWQATNAECVTRISGISFRGQSDARGVIYLSGKDFRIDHCEFEDLGYRAIMIFGNSNGVIDHCTFRGVFRSSIAIMGDAHASWAREHTLGTKNCVFIENCLFDYPSIQDSAVDAYSGARYVFRYNTVKNTNSGHHGNDGGNPRSTMQFEFYNNQYNAESGVFNAIYIRGGSGVIFNNEFSGEYYATISVTNYRTCIGEGYTGVFGLERCDGSDSIDGNFAIDQGQHLGASSLLTCTIPGKSWNSDEWVDYYLWNITDESKGLITGNTANTITVQALEGGTDNDFDTSDSIMITNGYPCQDQIGRSTNQILLPLFEWNNTKDGADADIIVPDNFPDCDGPAQVDHIKENRDYYNDVVTYNSVTDYYTATYTDDDGSQKEFSYRPYIYPHPLVTEQDGTGTKEISQIKSFNIYPNPASDYIIVQTHDRASPQYTAYLYNITGTLLKTIEINSNGTKIDLSDIMPGIYIIRMITTTNQYSAKLIKQ